MSDIRTVLVANRGEIAVRIIRACNKLGIDSVLAVSDADRDSYPAELASRVVCVGPSPASASYLNLAAIISAAQGTEADAIHPGYGFLSEDPRLAESCESNGIRFIGPKSSAIAAVGNKLAARQIADNLNIPTLAASSALTTQSEAVEAAIRIGGPVLVKAAAGGGGRGMRVVLEPDSLEDAIVGAAAEAQAAFGNPTLYIERYVADALHVEVQIIGDSHGDVRSLGDRDCSVQRRHQKVIEEAPAWRTPYAQREQMADDAVRLMTHIGYCGAGTVEFVIDRETGDHYFLEVNARLQVEHPVTEEVSGLDLVELQLGVCAGARLKELLPDDRAFGHAIELRINAENPFAGFMPSPGRILEWRAPGGPGIRIDTHCHAGYQVPPFYDSMIAKMIVSDRDRPRSIARARVALDEFKVDGIQTNVPLLKRVLADPDFVQGRFNTNWLERSLPNLLQSETASTNGGTL